ncbi:YqaE/Pmp3 family membrane protein [Vreelandella olivaria]|uniref:YqaE/Pmp3 family membrane protein n=1 Tax=Vreelandella olivaria TaxID=390919 RepID=UPI00201F03D2|nr:YqaE/Pmp3 family membrane protein [Halomonas olivaria]
MDAREYLNRQGVAQGHDPERPNTLEEKAWERARGAGSQRPKSGTPHDWEDWERHHDDLADGADALEQKIDKEAHRKALEAAQQKVLAKGLEKEERTPSQQSEGVVEYFTPPVRPLLGATFSRVSPTVNEESVVHDQPLSEPASLKVAYGALAVLLPPLAVGLTKGELKRVVTSFALTLFGWVPGVVYAFWWLNKR